MNAADWHDIGRGIAPIVMPLVLTVALMMGLLVLTRDDEF